MGGGIYKLLEFLVRAPQCRCRFLQLPFRIPSHRDIPEYKDSAYQFAMLILKRRGTVIDGKLIPVPGDQIRMVSHSYLDTFRKDFFDRIINLNLSRLVNDGEYLPDMPSEGFLLAPSGELLSHRIDKCNHAIDARCNYAVSDAGERGLEQLFSNLRFFV